MGLVASRKVWVSALAVCAGVLPIAACSTAPPPPARYEIGAPVSARPVVADTWATSTERQSRAQDAYNPSPRSTPYQSPGRSSLPKGGGYYKIGKPYQIKGRWYTPRVDPTYDEAGPASWYGPGFHGKKTANGEIFDQEALTAAHPTLPLPSYAYVTNLENGRTVLVRINDRGPFARDRILDASVRVARELGFHAQGTARVRVKYAGRAPLDGNDERERQHLARVSR